MTSGIVILGAGPSGLSTAYHLERLGYCNYAIYDKEERAGGNVHTRAVGGYLFDCGVHVLYFRHPHVQALVQHLLDGNLARHDRLATVYCEGVYLPYPFHANLWALPEAIRQECIQGFRTAAERHGGRLSPLLPEWIEATFGRGIAQYFMLPFNLKLWGPYFSLVDSDWLATTLQLDGLPEQVLGGAKGLSQTGLGNNRFFWYPVRGGIQSLADALRANIRNLELGMDVVQVNWKRRTVTFARGETRSYSLLVSSLPLSSLIDVLVPDLPPLHNLRTNLLHVSVACACVGVKHRIDPVAHWIYYGDPTLPFMRVSFPSMFSRNLTPEGGHSLIAEIPYHGRNQKDDLLEKTITGLIRVGLIRGAEDICAGTLIDIAHAYCVPLPDQRAAINEARDALNKLGIISIGRYGNWEYSNVEDALLWGERAVQQLVLQSHIPRQGFDRVGGRR